MSVDRYLSQIKAIAASGLVDQYLVGITADEQTRRLDYIREEFDYFFILDTKLSLEDALALESSLFHALVGNEMFRVKYHHEKRDKPYRASSGGTKGKAYCLYIAAFVP